MIYGRIKLPPRFQDPAFRWNLASYPATAPLSSTTGGPKGGTFKLTEPYLEWIRQNNSEKSADFVVADHTGWCNKYGISECLTMWGNVVQVKDKRGEWYLLDSLRPSDNPLLYSSPWYKHRFTVVTRKGYMRNPGAGLVCWFPFVINGPAWIHESGLEVSEAPLLPIYPGEPLPGLYKVVVLKGSVVRTSPGGNQAESPTRREKDAIETVYREHNDEWLEIGPRRFVEKSQTRRVT